MKDYLFYKELEKDLTPDSKVFYTNGCSMTYGAELYDVYDYTDVNQKFPYMPDDYHHERLKRGYAAVMHRELFPDRLFFNAAMGGSSNDRIYMNTVRHISSMIQKGVKPENIFASIQFTNMSRLLVFDRQDNRYNEVFLALKYDKKHYNTLAELHLKYFGSDESTMEQALLMIIRMQGFLKSTGVKYALSEGLPVMFMKNMGDLRPPVAGNPIYEMIDMTKWLCYNQQYFDQTQSLWCSNFGSWTRNSGLPQGPGFHPLEEAHQKWGEKIVQYIKDRKEDFL